MNFTQLKFVRETAKNNMNLTYAAKALHTSQPGVSKGVLELEEELGFEIFERQGRRLKGLTPLGFEALTSIEKILFEIEHLKKIKDNNAVDFKLLRIGATPDEANYLLPQYVKIFKEENPGVHVEIVKDKPEQLEELLVNKSLDFCLSSGYQHRSASLIVRPLNSWDYVLAVPKDHPLLEQEINLKNLSMYPTITYPMSKESGFIILQEFLLAGIKPNIEFEAEDTQTILQYRGLGICLVSDMILPDSYLYPDTVFVPINNIFGANRTSVVRNKELSKVASSFLKLF